MKTIGPLHLEDLEPHRFEDLVRQLLYDFRTWAQIEAIGRSGSDHGFDVRAQEVTTLDFEQVDNLDDEPEQPDLQAAETGRNWVVQCKREKSITPKKLATYMDELPDAQEHELYGVVFVAACDFSFAARDVFRRAAQEKGFSEAHLWGKGELEDMLFQPKNDYLLFAYFGISLQIKKRSIATSVRARLATKRKVIRILEKNHVGRYILIRDASDDRYPYGGGSREQPIRGRWRFAQYEQAIAQGVWVKLAEKFAYLADDRVSWDYMDSLNMSVPSSHEDYWTPDTDDLDSSKPSQFDYWEVWNALPDNNKANYKEYGIIPYENIIDIDEAGDQYFEGPHLYLMPYDGAKGPFKDGKRLRVELDQSWDNVNIYAKLEHRITWFKNIKELAEKILLERQEERPQN
ncbi:restriction endonuclease [Spirosoma pollinicola]|nr:restriction endonuclease [Spirosoma pollinicola]